MAGEAGPFGKEAGDGGGPPEGELNEWQVAEVSRALTEADADEFASEEVVDALFRKWLRWR